MSCPYHKGEGVPVTGVVTQVKKYNPPLTRRIFKSVNVIWFNKIEVDGEDSIHYTLYDFQEKAKPETRSYIPAMPRKGEDVTLSYYPLAKKVRGCIKELFIL